MRRNWFPRFNFDLSGGGAALTVPGSLSSSISNGTGGPVVMVDPGGATTVKPASWQFNYDSGLSAFRLNDLTGGQPASMIIGPGPYTNANKSISSAHNASLAGPVDFEIDNFAGLTLNSTISKVIFSFGTGPDGLAAGFSCDTPDCSGTLQDVTAEPLSFLLLGTGLGLLAMAHRKFGARK